MGVARKGSDWGVNWATGIVPQISDVEVVGYVVRSQESAAIARVRLGDSVTPFFLSLEEAVEKTAPDGVLILTTTEAHVDLVSRALTLGCHVLVEKPFVPTVAEGRILVQMAENRGLILMVNQNFRFFPAAQRAADLVRVPIFVLSALMIFTTFTASALVGLGTDSWAWTDAARGPRIARMQAILRVMNAPFRQELADSRKFLCDCRVALARSAAGGAPGIGLNYFSDLKTGETNLKGAFHECRSRCLS